MMYVPEGFAHGFITLTDNVELLYHHTAFYTPTADRGLRYDDPQVKIQWPEPVEMISAKDKSYPLLDEWFTGVNINN